MKELGVILHCVLGFSIMEARKLFITSDNNFVDCSLPFFMEI